LIVYFWFEHQIKTVNLKQNVHQVYWLYTYTHRALIQPLHKIEYSNGVHDNKSNKGNWKLYAHREILNILCVQFTFSQAVFQEWKLLTREDIYYNI
jgi:hypothetical protein